MRYLIAALLALPSVALAAALTLAATHAMGDPLDGIVIEDENNTPYARNMYGGWRDADHDCQDARQEVLIAESLVPPTLDDAGCRVVSGLWYGLFSGQAFTDPSKLDIDHLVPLKEAHQSGGHAWTRDRRRAQANDLSNPGHLIAVRLGANRSKGFKDPAEWLPTNKAFHCAYVLTWIGVKRAWALSMDGAEAAAIRDVLEDCE